jgi:hypothetical protein
MARYRKRPVEVEAVQWTGDNNGEVAAMFASDLKGISPIGRTGEKLVIRTLEGTMTASKGDWIIRDVAGEAYPCRDHIFRKAYEAVDAP